jgi:hypothetical protein
VVNWAGTQLVVGKPGQTDYDGAIEIIDNWRSSHSFPLNAMQILLRRQAARVDSNALIAQRIKRLSSVELKLRRFRTMKLSQMQDLGGCRAVVRSVSAVKKLVESFKSSQTHQELDDIDDYIENPKKSGYRGVHLIYKFRSERSPKWNGLRIEIQLRSPLQHAWATAVETVGTFTRQALKSSKGETEWLRFFELMGTAIAQREGTPGVPGTPEKRRQLVQELRTLNRGLRVVPRLHAFGKAMQVIESGSSRAYYYLLVLDSARQEVRVQGFARPELERANEAYFSAEKETQSNTVMDAVLVSVDSIASLKRAYPNYFLDTTSFTDTVRKVLKG